MYLFQILIILNPWFNFSFLVFLGMVIYVNNMTMSLKQKKRKFEPRIIKLNHNIDTSTCMSCTELKSALWLSKLQIITMTKLNIQ